MPKFTLTIDDQSPHDEAGLNFEVIRWCDKLIEKYPNFKITLFTPAAYARLDGKPHYLSHYPKWVERMNDLNPNNYQIGLHGLKHRRSAKDYVFHAKKPPSNNDEFQFLNKEEAQLIIGHMLYEFDKAGLRYSKVFRPPGWKISVSTARELTRENILISTNEQYCDILKDKVPNIRSVSATWHLEKDIQVSGDVVAASHSSKWVFNFLDETRYNMICRVLEQNDYEFCFLEDMVDKGYKTTLVKPI